MKVTNQETLGFIDINNLKYFDDAKFLLWLCFE